MQGLGLRVPALAIPLCAALVACAQTPPSAASGDARAGEASSQAGAGEAPLGSGSEGSDAPAEPALPIDPALAALASPPALPTRGLEFYAGARLVALGPGARYASVRLGATTATFVDADGAARSYPVDLSATHPDCWEVPTCLLRIGEDHALERLFFGVQDELLFHVQCTETASLRATGGDAAVEEWRRIHGGWLVHDTDRVICYNTRETPYEVRRGPDAADDAPTEATDAAVPPPTDPPASNEEGAPGR